MGVDENWRPVPGFEGRYSVSDLGDVFSHRAGRCLAPLRSTSGHLAVALGRGNRRHIHSLVLLTFVGPRSSGQECRHLNSKPTDNRLVNLEWASRSVNSLDKKWHNSQQNYKLTPDDVRRMRARRAEGATTIALGKEFGVSQAHASKVVSMKSAADVV